MPEGTRGELLGGHYGEKSTRRDMRGGEQITPNRPGEWVLAVLGELFTRKNSQLGEYSTRKHPGEHTGDR